MEAVIAIPCWDARESQSNYTRNIVRQILGETQGDFHLAVVDNASPFEATRAFLDSVQDPRFTLIRFPENQGVACGYNAGMKWGYEHGAQFFVCLNNDVIFENPAWLQILLSPLRQNPKQIVGPRRINYNLNVNLDGRVFTYIEGFMMATTRLGLDTFGLLDEQFSPAYCEDVEWCWRAIQNGFALAEVSVPHHHIYGQTGYVNFGDEKRITATLNNVRKLHDKVNRGDTRKVWCE